jgi:ABC-type nitrate/sulfonate/bicarbonate transport system substrate-binding protein
MRPPRRHSPLRIIAALAFAISCLAIAGAAADEPAVKGDGGTVRLLVNIAGTQSFPPYVIQHFGLAKKWGFSLETVPSSTTQTTTTAFQSHAGDIGIVGWNDLSRVKAGGVKIVGIAPFLGWANTIVVPVDSPISTLGDLKGKKVGVYSRTSTRLIRPMRHSINSGPARTRIGARSRCCSRTIAAASKSRTGRRLDSRDAD